jgi:hypothetical protein
MEVNMIPDGLHRCDQCGALRGEFLYRWGNDDQPTMTPVKCLCEGIVCRYCRRNAIHRPISNHYDEQTCRVLHVSHLGYLAACEQCWLSAEPTASPSESGQFETRQITSTDGTKGITVLRASRKGG